MIIHIMKNGEIHNTISGVKIRSGEFYAILKRIIEERK